MEVEIDFSKIIQAFEVAEQELAKIDGIKRKLEELGKEIQIEDKDIKEIEETKFYLI